MKKRVVSSQSQPGKSKRVRSPAAKVIRERSAFPIVAIRPSADGFADIDDLKRIVNETRTYADAVIEHAREAILILDPKLRITAANRAFYAMFRFSREQAENKSLTEIAEGKWIPAGLREPLQRIVRGETLSDTFETKHRFADGGLRTMLFSARRIEPTRGQPVILLSIDDVTEQKRRVSDLQTHSALLELANDAVLVRDLEGNIQLWNHGAERIYGWTKGEVLGKHVYELLKTQFPIPLQDVMQEIMRTGYWEGELLHTRKDGEQRVVQSRWSLRRESDPQTILELNTDITDRKRFEDLLRRLSTQLMQAQDDERRRIARDLHDSTGQKLVALKLSLEQNRPGGKVHEEEVKLVDEVLQEIRTVAQLLHPPLLEEAGLLSAMRWLAEGFSVRAGIKVVVQSSDSVDRLPPNVEIALFRVTQEALNNIHHHSGAKAAQIHVSRNDGVLLLRIKDDGRGIRASRSGSPAETVMGVGLLGMRERLSQLGGSLTIDSSPKGTTIEAQVPLGETSDTAP